MKIAKSILIMFMLIYFHSDKLLSQWSQVGLTTDRIMSLAVASNGSIFAGTYSNGLYKSTDRGSVWTQVLGPPSVSEVYSIAFDSSGGILAGTYYAGLYRSTNSGSNWTLLSSDIGPNNLPVDDIYSIAVNPTGTIFAVDGANNVGWVYRSTDVGSTWQSVLNPSYGLITLASNSAGVMYTGGGAWFYYSTNSGDSWTWKGSSSGLTKAPLILVAGDAGLVFAGTSGNGVFFSTNNGVNWSAVNTNLTNKYITALFLHDTTLYAGTDGGGVFVSTNNGSSWNANNTGLTNQKVYSLAVGDSCLYAGTYGSGVWKLPLSEVVTSVSSPVNEMPVRFHLSQNYPNPFNPSTNIFLSLPVRSFVSLKVFDVIGREVATIISKEMSAGSYSRIWNAEGLPSGVYFYRLSVVPAAQRDLIPTIGWDGQAGSFTETKKLVLLK